MSNLIFWWACLTDNKLRYGDGREAREGVSHTVDTPDPTMCNHGLHAATTPRDAIDWLCAGLTWEESKRLFKGGRKVNLWKVKVDVTSYEPHLRKVVGTRREYIKCYRNIDVKYRFEDRKKLEALIRKRDRTWDVHITESVWLYTLVCVTLGMALAVLLTLTGGI